MNDGAGGVVESAGFRGGKEGDGGAVPSSTTMLRPATIGLTSGFWSSEMSEQHAAAGSPLAESCPNQYSFPGYAPPSQAYEATSSIEACLPVSTAAGSRFEKMTSTPLTQSPWVSTPAVAAAGVHHEKSTAATLCPGASASIAPRKARSDSTACSSAILQTPSPSPRAWTYAPLSTAAAWFRASRSSVSAAIRIRARYTSVSRKCGLPLVAWLHSLLNRPVVLAAASS
mmetsp:Transcript_2241/g.4822  ORF Transcript_2241/g.4822 Transcript_2241/m.4822 type:complete len:228 (-) Transcript_2241:413-1096(-)